MIWQQKIFLLPEQPFWQHLIVSLIFGVFYDIEKHKEWIKKFENLMGEFEYADNKLFAKFPNIDYESAIFKIKGKFKKVNLLDINSSDELIEKVINPVIKIYEGI